MDWLKELLGEQLFAKLEKSEFYKEFGQKLKGKYLYDSKKHMPKEEFNKKNNDLKDYKKQLEDTKALYEAEKNKYKDMITADEHKAKLADMEKTFKSEMESKESTFKQQIETREKEFENATKLSLAEKMLIDNGVSKEDADLLINKVSLDQLVVKDGEILNEDSIILPMKEKYKKYFGNPNVIGTPPVGGTKTNSNMFEEALQEAKKSGDIAREISIQMQYDDWKKNNS
jgi:hypothetical protein